ncbi:MAG: pseudouridine synthase [Candidatus Omnitrophota bacterium]
MRLNAFIAKAGLCARRKAVAYIKEGRVCVGGRVVREPWHEVKEDAHVTVDGKDVGSQREAYLAFNKPKGVTVTLEDRFASRKIIDMIPKRYGRIYPVGRLDKDSRGLILLTTDGDLCHRLTHPRFEIEKEYAVSVDSAVTEDQLEQVRRGIADKGDVLNVRSCKIVRSAGGVTELEVIAAEGKKRHLRRIFKKLGLNVIDLRRVRIGGLKLDALGEGKFRELDRETVYDLTLGKGVSK